MGQRRTRTARPPLDAARLGELALAYVGRFATTRAKLSVYLERKIRERGWAGQAPPDVEAIAQRLASLGYIDDAAFALSRARSLTERGYGSKRVRHSLRAAGVGDEDSEPARELAQAGAVESALRFARRRRIGPFGSGTLDRAARQRALAAMVRAGHGFGLANAILALEPGSEVDVELLAEKA
ncbi:MAG TPA: RecX family transcriptional regulator [Sphingomicrobium sp.]|nr:RecX family transcriptional regulator [Sphingomicrobium sp.]